MTAGTGYRVPPAPATPPPTPTWQAQSQAIINNRQVAVTALAGENYMKREIRGFFLAPLVVPIGLTPSLLSGHITFGWLVTTLLIALIVTYIGMVLMGLPIYNILMRRNLRAFWFAVVVGMLIGGVTWMLFLVLFPLSLGQGLSGVKSALSDLRSLRGLIWPGGALGGMVGLLFWIISRPDRRAS
jgi:hypothetical protein